MSGGSFTHAEYVSRGEVLAAERTVRRIDNEISRNGYTEALIRSLDRAESYLSALKVRAAKNDKPLPKIKKTKKSFPRFAEYVRVSTMRQVESGTYHYQREDLVKYRSTVPGTLILHSEDLGESGVSAHRAGLNKIFELVEAKCIDELRVWSYDRLVRSAEAADIIWDRLTSNRVRIVEVWGELHPADAFEHRVRLMGVVARFTKAFSGEGMGAFSDHT